MRIIIIHHSHFAHQGLAPVPATALAQTGLRVCRVGLQLVKHAALVPI
jgi:hypothetical protein